MAAKGKTKRTAPAVVLIKVIVVVASRWLLKGNGKGRPRATKNGCEKVRKHTTVEFKAADRTPV